VESSDQDQDQDQDQDARRASIEREIAELEASFVEDSAEGFQDQDQDLIELFQVQDQDDCNEAAQVSAWLNPEVSPNLSRYPNPKS